MALTDPRKPFTELMVKIIPSQPGVYVLWDDQHIIYIGSANGNGGLRDQLLAHYFCHKSPTPNTARNFQVEVSPRPKRLMDRLLAEYTEEYGAPPRFNA